MRKKQLDRGKSRIYNYGKKEDLFLQTPRDERLAFKLKSSYQTHCRSIMTNKIPLFICLQNVSIESQALNSSSWDKKLIAIHENINLCTQSDKIEDKYEGIVYFRKILAIGKPT